MSKSRKILRRLAVCEKVGLSPVQVWRKANDPEDDFPAAVSLGPNATGWFEDELDDWLESRPRGCGQQKPHLAPHYKRGVKGEPDAALATAWYRSTPLRT